MKTLKYWQKHAKSEGAFITQMYRLRKSMSLEDIVLHVLHVVSERDDLPLCERLVKEVGRAKIGELVNTQLGRNCYTPMHRAGYAGSPRMLKYLVTQGADPLCVNDHGEDVPACIRQGQDDAVQTRPDDAIFLRPRFEECLKFIEKHREAQAARERRHAMPPVNAFVPRRVRRHRAAVVIAQWWAKQKRGKSAT